MATIQQIYEILEENKAESITTINVEKITSMTDHLIICTGRSKRHVDAVAEYVKLAVKENEGFSPNIQGQQGSEWVILDLHNIIVHIMTKDIREFYQLEKLWDKELVLENTYNNDGN